MPPKKNTSTTDTERAKKFTSEEIYALVDTISPIYGKLFGILNQEVTHEVKQTLWAHITDAVNAVSLNKRSVIDVQNKWTQMKCRVKKKASNVLLELRKTGGGINESDPLTDLELRAKSLSLLDKKIIRLIGATALIGIKGGIDTSIENENQNNTINNNLIENKNESISLVLLNESSLEEETNSIELIEIPSKSKSRKRKTEPETDSIASQMLKTQLEIKNALLELVEIQRQKLEIKKQKLALYQYRYN